MRFRNKQTDKIGAAYSLEVRGNKVCVRFKKDGKEYTYRKDNIEVLDGEGEAADENNFIVYKLIKQCYKCRKDTSVFTYIVFNDGTDQNVTYPWDKRRLLKNQDVFVHLQDPGIEYYGLKVVGEDKKLDGILMKKFPDKIKTKYSGT